jgi:hypothetical protein
MNMRLRYYRTILDGLWLSRFGTDILGACEAMFVLNRFVYKRRGFYSFVNFVYGLKNVLVRHLYQGGYCIAAAQQEQIKECWGYRDQVCDEYCEKCGGTGIFQRHVLYAFTFAIPDKRPGVQRQISFDEHGKLHHFTMRTFKWHQPAGLVTWPVTLTSSTVTRFEAKESESEDLDDVRAFTLAMSIWWCLCLRGQVVKLPVDLIPRIYQVTKFQAARRRFKSRIRKWACSVFGHNIQFDRFGNPYCKRCGENVHHESRTEIPF